MVIPGSDPWFTVGPRRLSWGFPSLTAGSRGEFMVMVNRGPPLVPVGIPSSTAGSRGNSLGYRGFLWETAEYRGNCE